MTVEELVNMANDKIAFELSKETLLIKSLAYMYADFIKTSSIESIECNGSVVSISVPTGTSMGDHDIAVDLTTGIVTADGKVFDEPLQRASMQSNKVPNKRFTPTINGFSIGSVHTMPSEDGYACSCKVYFNGKKVGDFVDKGDGGEYSFYADRLYSTSKIEQIIRSFPPTVRDYGLGKMEVQYDMNQMVNDLMEMKEIAKELQKLEVIGKNYIRIDEWKSDRHLTASIASSVSDEELAEMLNKDLSKRGLTDYEVRRYRNLEELRVVNTFVCENIFK